MHRATCLYPLRVLKLGEPKYDIRECKECDTTYAAPLRVQIRLVNHETGEIKDQEVFMGDFPLITDTGTFIINGAERVIVSQLVRSPGVYYGREIDPMGIRLYNSTVIPNRGAWIELETDANDIVYARIDRNRKILSRSSSARWAGRRTPTSSNSSSTINA
mgnify:FL=1